MRRIAITALSSVLALLAIGGLLASAATAAAPEFKVCAKAAKVDKKYTGRYTSKTCADAEPKGEGRYERDEWSKAKKRSYTGKNAGSIRNNVIDPLVGGTIEATTECSGESVIGEVSGPKTETWSTVYTGCKLVAAGAPGASCQTAGAKEGEIKTQQLEGTLVYLNSAKTIPGLRVRPRSGDVLAAYSCLSGVVGIEATGELLVERKGDVSAASKNSETIAREGPKHGQDPYYEEEAHSETEAFASFDFDVCVEEEEGAGLGESEAGIACATKLGPPPPSPISVIAKIDEAGKGIVAPATEVSTTKNKGEAFLIEL